MLFAGMSGSSVAAIASIGKMSINALNKKSYPMDYSTAINLAGSMLASVIPPSILMRNRGPHSFQRKETWKGFHHSHPGSSDSGYPAGGCVYRHLYPD
jgi:hypothetical protein